MHYTQLPTEELTRLWDSALTEGLGLKAPARLRSSEAIGSRHRLSKAVLSQTFSALRAEIDQDRTSETLRPIRNIAESHERFAVYTLELLAAATGHRPVDAPFENIADIDLETGLLGISDKAVSGGRSERVVALPPSALIQLGHWISHLEALHSTLSWRVDPGVAERISAALGHGTMGMPLFFFLSPEGDIIEPWRSEITACRRYVLPVQANLSRHVLRSHLVAADVTPDAIDASLGHARLGEEPWGAISTLSISDLRSVADAAEELLQLLSLTPCAGPLETLS